MKIQSIFFLIIAFSIMTACAPDPRKQADAIKTVIEAQQFQLNETQNRQHADELFQMQKQQQELLAARNAETEQNKRDALNRMLYAAGLMGTAAIAFAIFITTRSTLRAYEHVAIGLAQAMVQGAEIRSRLIPLDPVTGQYPLVIEHLGRGLITLTDPNTATVLQLDTRQPGDRQMIDGAMAVRHTFVLSSAAARSQVPAGVSIIDAPRQYQYTEGGSDE